MTALLRALQALGADVDGLLDTLTYDADQAAARLGGPFTADYLTGNLDRFPHGRLGQGRGRAGRIFFTEDHLRRIVQLLDQDAAAPGSGGQAAAFTPLTRRRSA